MKTKKECYEELERMARIIADYKIGKLEFANFKLAFVSVLRELDKIKDKERANKEFSKIERRKKKYGIVSNKI